MTPHVFAMYTSFVTADRGRFLPDRATISSTERPLAAKFLMSSPALNCGPGMLATTSDCEETLPSRRPDFIL